ncbi:hypothetical protein H096_11763 [Pseudomonas sp. FH1]|nr:hypothetical protein H096_11763 [Pseudomonas sp. FH1]
MHSETFLVLMRWLQPGRVWLPLETKFMFEIGMRFRLISLGLIYLRIGTQLKSQGRSGSRILKVVVIESGMEISSMLLIGRMMVFCCRRKSTLQKIGFGQQISIWNLFLMKTLIGGR